ncbi:MAG: F0F1 ATP synthase subunit A [SAR202 cluster bacterium]|nr:F0F1 ATP synthase subunit A [SAR202 cluster bacterium]
MSSLLGNPKMLTAVIAVGILFILGLAGGALGNQFGGGFLGAPLAPIELKAEPIGPDPIIGDFKITNTMVNTWIAIVILGLISFLGTRRATEIPSRLQGFLEIIIEFFLSLAESVAGPENARRFFPLATTIFLFIVTSNWLGILPGVGTIGWVESPEEVKHHKEAALDDPHDLDLGSVNLQVFDGDGGLALLSLGSIDNTVTLEEFKEHGVDDGKRAGILIPFFRSANTDINTPLSMAIIAMFMVHFWGLRSLGVFGHVGKFMNFKEGPIGAFVGVLEAIGEAARVISFTFRLFGNIFAGEVLLIAMSFLIPLVGLVPFLGLELFVGLIQAFIFSMLTLVFAASASISHGSEEH